MNFVDRLYKLEQMACGTVAFEPEELRAFLRYFHPSPEDWQGYISKRTRNQTPEAFADFVLKELEGGRGFQTKNVSHSAFQVTFDNSEDKGEKDSPQHPSDLPLSLSAEGTRTIVEHKYSNEKALGDFVIRIIEHTLENAPPRLVYLYNVGGYRMTDIDDADPNPMKYVQKRTTTVQIEDVLIKWIKDNVVFYFSDQVKDNALNVLTGLISVYFQCCEGPEKDVANYHESLRSKVNHSLAKFKDS